MEFCKLNKEFVVNDYEMKEIQTSFMKDGKGIAYHYVNFNNFNIFDIIPEKHKEHFSVTLMHINTTIPPHTDSGIKSTINIYLQTDNCLTQFYKFKNGNPKTEQVNNQTDGFIFDELDLEKTNAFIAKTNEAWLLNVSQPHSVIPQEEFNNRLAVAIGSPLEYSVVYNILKGEGHI
jgi:ABC-type tungstate transport system permease subunit